MTPRVQEMAIRAKTLGRFPRWVFFDMVDTCRTMSLDDTGRSLIVHIVQNFASITSISEMKDWSQVSVETDPCIGVTRRALSDMMETIRAEVNRLSKSGKSINSSLELSHLHLIWWDPCGVPGKLRGLHWVFLNVSCSGIPFDHSFPKFAVYLLTH